ncbi:MAG TPA: adenylate/guanylate cyclase domain-containing protein [Longimicrobiaceae bacterium]
MPHHRRSFAQAALAFLLIAGSLEELMLVVRPRAVLAGYYRDELASDPGYLAGVGAFAWVPVLVATATEVLIAALGLALVWRAWDRREARALAAFLALAGLGLPDGLGIPGPAHAIFDHVVLAFAMAALVHFSLVFPEPLSPQAPGWPPRWLRPLLAPEWLVAGAFAAAGAMVLLVPFDAADLLALPILLAAVLLAATNLRGSYRRSPPAYQHRVLWVLNGVYALAWTIILAIPAAFAIYITAAVFATRRASAVADIAFYSLVGAGVLLLPAFLAIGVFYEGAVDPRLGIRKTTVYGAMGVLTLSIFVVVEGVTSASMMSVLRLPAHLGTWVAGGGVALAFGPLRRWVERRTEVMVGRLLPATALAEGAREEAVIVFADLCGYTRISATDEAAALTLASLFHATARRMGQAHGGRLVKTLGDGVVLAFTTGNAAVAAAMELRERFLAAARAMGLQPPDLRCGIHCGAVARGRDGDLFGGVVNLASRLEGAATPGEVLVSQEVARTLTDTGRVWMEPAGERTLKNVPYPVATWRVIPAVHGPPTWRG